MIKEKTSNDKTERLIARINLHLSDIGSGWMADDEIEVIRDHVRDLQAENEAFEAAVVALQARVAELENASEQRLRAEMRECSICGPNFIGLCPHRMPL